MKAILVFKHGEVDRCARSIAAVLLSILLLQTSIGFIANAQASQRAPKKSGKMSDDQRIAQVLSRLTFGARPGDFERVKAMGVDAFINQQLDPDLIDNTGVIVKLRRFAQEDQRPGNLSFVQAERALEEEAERIVRVDPERLLQRLLGVLGALVLEEQERLAAMHLGVAGVLAEHIFHHGFACLRSPRQSNCSK